jgi:5'-nucleotidase
VPFPGVLPWDTVRMQGRLVGIFGLTMTGRYRSYVRCADPDSAAGAAIDSLDRLGAQFIIGLTHQPIADDRSLLRREPELNLILGGHEHHAITEMADGRYILKADANSRSVQFATVWGAEGAWRQAVNLVRVDGTIPADTTVRSITERWQDSLRARLGPEQVIGTAPEPIDARDAVSRQGETAIGRIVTDALRSGTGADVALLNSGTLRLDDVVPAGPVTNYTIESFFLFADESRIVTFPLTGRRLRALLEHGVTDRSIGAGPFLQVSGVAFAYDPARPDGSRIVGPLRRPDGGTIAEGDTLRVSFGVYPACEGGDGYVIPEAAEACRTWEAAPRAADLVVRHLREELGGRIAAPAAGRILRQGS